MLLFCASLYCMLTAIAQASGTLSRHDSFAVQYCALKQGCHALSAFMILWVL